jgi:GDPmannose 4,6-dehydratase
MAEKTALIVGVTGQDGAHLARHLLGNGYAVHGTFRRETSNKLWRLEQFGILDRVKLAEFEIGDTHSIIRLLSEVAPNEIYHLAGHSMVADSFKHPGVTIQANTLGVLNVLEAMRLIVPQSRLFFASSSEVFGECPSGTRLCESSPQQPSNPYGVSKLSAQHLVRLYRETYGLFAVSGILFNHEGPVRARQFVTRKITYNVVRLKNAGGQPMVLGELDAARDWGAAEDYVKAMTLMLAAERPEDLVVATGHLTTVRDFLRIAAEAAGFQPEFQGSGLDEVCRDKASGLEIGRVSDKYLRKHGTPPLVGNAARLTALTGWRPQQDIKDIIMDMIGADQARFEQGVTNV